MGRGARRAHPWSGCLVALVLLYAGGKKEKVVTSRAGFNPKPRVGLGSQATNREMEIRQELYTRKS